MYHQIATFNVCHEAIKSTLSIDEPHWSEYFFIRYSVSEFFDEIYCLGYIFMNLQVIHSICKT